MIRCDVLVAGGGSAGLAAAIAAARAGAETLLIERGGMLGGMATQALVHTICGLYAMREEPGAVFANEGFAPEFARRLIACGGACAPVRMGRLDVLPHDPVMFAGLADELAAETSKLRVWLHAELFAAEGSATRLDEIEIICRGAREKVAARAFIDGTGDASLVAVAGAEFAQAPSEFLQRPAYVALVRGIDPALLEGDGRLQLAHAMARAVKTGDLPSAALGASFRPAIARDEAHLTIDLAADESEGEKWEPTSPRMLASVEAAGRRTALAIARFFKGCRVVAWPARAGVRESRRAAGVYELSGDEVLTGAQFDDGVVSTAWPMELREKPTGPRWRFPEPGPAAQVPLRCLHHGVVQNLWVAGRCLSASHEAQSSIRVIGTCLATGEAAGLAAVGALGQPAAEWPELAARVRRRRAMLARSC